jgi:hypothetical protein
MLRAFTLLLLIAFGALNAGCRCNQEKILKAEGEREASFREAEARERLAEAEARATRMVSEAIAHGDIQAINYFIAQKYVDALGQIASAPNQKVVLMPLEATSILGSLAGIGEISREIFGNREGGAAATAVPQVRQNARGSRVPETRVDPNPESPS